jgi:hypothetical protein
VDLVNRGTRHDDIDRWVRVRNLWRERHLISFDRRMAITDATANDLHKFLDWILVAKTHSDFKLVTSGDIARIYSNDLELLNRASQLPYATLPEYSQAVIDRPLDTIRLKTVNHRYRSYLRSTKITDTQKNSLVALLTNADDLRLSPTLKRWVEFGAYHSYDYLFIDHNDLSWLTMISLIRSGIIRKTVEIIPDNK